MNQLTLEWQQANSDHLMSRMEILRAKLEMQLGIQCDLSALLAREEKTRHSLPGPSAVQQIADLFQLTSFECELMLLCAAVELLPAMGELCALLQKDPLATFPTIALGMAALEDPAWISVTPEAPLRRFGLVELQDGPSLAKSRLRIPERVLHYLCGVELLDPGLSVIQRATATSTLVPSQLRSVDCAVRLIQNSEGSIPPIQFIGPNAQSVAFTAAEGLNLSLYTIEASDLPPDLPAFISTWTREALLLSAVLLVNVEEPEFASRVSVLAARARFPLFIASNEKLPIQRTTAIDVSPAEACEVADLWRAALGPAGEQLNGKLETLSKHFQLGSDAIQHAANAALQSDRDLADALWSECRMQSRQRLDELAHRIESRFGWDDIVLPDAHLSTLREIVNHVRQRAKVYDTWGFADRSSRGLGISALFCGPSGTGKTLAAEVIAGALDLDLYRIDLSGIVSKYLGETEKNLSRIFAAAEGSGAVLLFDEADAIFGKRTEVKDSHDRYANIEVGYLLQRMEAYQGLVILTSNLKNSLDPAFLRRIRFMLQFPFPEAEERQRIWERAFPDATPRAELDIEQLAQLAVAGGNIRNIAINAAFLAAGDDKSVCMDHLIQAARTEFAKLERPMPELQIGGTR